MATSSVEFIVGVCLFVSVGGCYEATCAFRIFHWVIYLAKRRATLAKWVTTDSPVQASPEHLPSISQASFEPLSSLLRASPNRPLIPVEIGLCWRLLDPIESAGLNPIQFLFEKREEREGEERGGGGGEGE